MTRNHSLHARWIALLSSSMALLAGQLPAQEVAAAAKNPRVTITTNLGRFVIELDPIRAPLTVENFLQYVREGHYSGTIFHRVVHGFVAQGGGFDADLQQKPAPRMVVTESGNGLSNLRGTVRHAGVIPSLALSSKAWRSSMRSATGQPARLAYSAVTYPLSPS
jgi:hypothetical protein